MLVHRDIESVVPRPQVLPIRKGHPDSKDSHFRLRSQIPKPLVRTQARRGVSDLARVQKGPKSYREDSVAINVLICLPVGQKIVAAQGRASLSAIAGSDVPPHRKIVVA